MPRKQTFLIPDDFDPDLTSWSLVTICIPNTTKWRGIISGSIYSLTRGRYWDASSGNIKDTQVIAERIYNSMAIDCNNSLERIATSLENLDQKIAGRVTYEEMIADLEEIVGVGSILKLVVSSFFGLFPRVRAKLDFGAVAMMLWDWWKWKRPITDGLSELVKWTKVNAIAGAGSELITTTLTGWQTLSLWLLDWINGETDLAEQLGYIGWSTVPDEKGGTGGVNPDADPSLRIAVSLNISNKVQNELNFACCDNLNLGETVANRLSAGDEYVSGASPAPIYPSPVGEDPPLDYGVAVSDQGKCNYAEWLADRYIAMLNGIVVNKQTITSAVESGGPLLLIVSGIIAAVMGFAAAPFVIVLGVTAILWALIGLGGETWIDRLNSAKEAIIGDKEGLRCALYSASNANEARGNVNSFMLEKGIDKLTISLMDTAMPNHVINGLFLTHPEVNIGSTVGVCSGCGEPVTCSGIDNFSVDPEFDFVDAKRIDSPVQEARATVAHGWADGKLYITHSAGGTYTGGYFIVPGFVGYVMGANDHIRIDVSFSGTGTRRGYLYVIFGDGTKEYVGGDSFGTYTVYGSDHLGKAIASVYLITEALVSADVYFDNLDWRLCDNA